MIFLVFILCVWTTGRVSRLLATDELLDEPRDHIIGWLTYHGRPEGQPMWQPPLWRRKLAYLITCVWCNSLYVAGALVLGMLWFTSYSTPLPLLWWPALSMGAVISVNMVDGEANVGVRMKKDPE